MNHFETARLEEMAYHEDFYRQHQIFQPGSWLAKPVKTVMDAFELLNGRQTSILDLGCGVGRNSIPLAQKLVEGNVICVDLLETALSILIENARNYDVEQFIAPVHADAEHFLITPDSFDFIVACSCLEHVSTEEALIKVLNGMQTGTRKDGVHCILMSTEVRELDLRRKAEEEGNIELNLGTDKAFEVLHLLYKDWEILKSFAVPQKIIERKRGREIEFKSNWITFVARNSKEDPAVV